MKEEKCKNCGHSINWHRFLKSAKPDACVYTYKNDDGSETYCDCNKYVKP